ncbi:MAG: hypothetical protein AB1921_15990 [Thermodesulfobacteriota bacterium]
MPENENRYYLYFLSALKHWVSEEGRGAQNYLAASAKKSGSYVSQILRDVAPASFDVQVELAQACGYDYMDFLALGRDLVEGPVWRKDQGPLVGKPGLAELVGQVVEAIGSDLFNENLTTLLKVFQKGRGQ